MGCYWSAHRSFHVLAWAGTARCWSGERQPVPNLRRLVPFAFSSIVFVFGEIEHFQVTDYAGE